MRTRGIEKLHSVSGISRLVAILLVLVIVLAVAAFIPTWQKYKGEADNTACAIALETIRRDLAYDTVGDLEDLTLSQGKQIITTGMWGRDELCPAGGDCYIVRRETGDLPYEVVCGLHNSDRKERTRLNAAYVLDQVKERVRKAQQDGEEYPASVPVRLNGEDYTAVSVMDETGLKRGTHATSGYDGTVIFYSIVGQSAFGADSGLADGEVWYFSFADEEYCANWANKAGWTGDAYS